MRRLCGDERSRAGVHPPGDDRPGVHPDARPGCRTPTTPAAYTDDDIRRWADRIARWDGDGKDVWMYFNNDLGGHAVRNALALRELLG